MKRLLAALVVTLGLAAVAHAVCDSRTTTCLTNLSVSGTLTAGSVDCGTTGTFTSATVTALSVSTATISGTQGLRLAQGNITAASTVPAAANILAHDSSFILYISTGTGAGAWVKVGGQ